MRQGASDCCLRRYVLCVISTYAMPFSPEGLSEVLRGTVSGLESVREPGLCGLKLPARDFEGERLSLRLPLLGDREPEHESPFRAVRHFDSAAVEKYGVAYDRQAESGASRPARTPLVDPVETFEEVGQVFGIDARAVVRE